jgi:hypothetical protein
MGFNSCQWYIECAPDDGGVDSQSPTKYGADERTRTAVDIPDLLRHPMLVFNGHTGGYCHEQGINHQGGFRTQIQMECS